LYREAAQVSGRAIVLRAVISRYAKYDDQHETRII
jgi:hypothetical protein